MGRFVLFSLLCILCNLVETQSLQAEIFRVNVGKQPLAVFFNEQNFCYDIFCGGLDADYDGVEDPGDEKPSWWRMPVFPILTIIELDSPLAKKLRDFEFGYIGFPFRPGIMKEQNILLITHLGRVRAFSLEDGSVIHDTLASINANALSVRNDKIYMSVRDYSGNNNVYIYDYAARKVTDTLIAEANVQQTVPLGNDRLAVLCEGNFGKDDSKVLLYSSKSGKYQLDTAIQTGIAGNHLEVKGKYLAVTMNGSHEVKLFDINNYNLMQTFHVPTTGYDGPRESAIEGSILTTTAYSGSLYQFDINTGNLIDSIDAFGKAESFIYNFNADNALVIATPFIKNSYSVDTMITVYWTLNSVKANQPEFIRIYPNPVRDNINIEIQQDKFNLTNFNISYRDIKGNFIDELSFRIETMTDIFRYNLKDHGFSPGTYFLSIKTGDRTYVYKFLVVD